MIRPVVTGCGIRQKLRQMNERLRIRGNTERLSRQDRRHGNKVKIDVVDRV